MSASMRFVFPEIFRHYRERTESGLPPAGILQGSVALWTKLLVVLAFAAVARAFTRNANAARLWTPTDPATERNLYFFTSRNQRDAMSRVFKRDPDALTLTHRDTLKSDALLDRRALNRLAYRFVGQALADFVAADIDMRRFMADFTMRYLRACAWNAAFENLLQVCAPACVILTNDHLPMHRTLLLCCQRLGIKSIYFQHAAVTDRFPPLSFSYALLEGADSLATYRRAGPCSSRVSLVGIPKLSGPRPTAPGSRDIRDIGLCLKTSSQPERVAETCGRLRTWFPDLRLRVRPHPRLAGPALRAIRDHCGKRSIDVSDPAIESSAQFLSRVHLIVGGNSSVLLDAAMLDVVPIYFSGMEGSESHDHDGLRSYCMGCYYGFDRDDYYGFKASGLCLAADNVEQVRVRIQEALVARPDVRESARRYCETIGTPFEGRSDELVADCIRAIRAGIDPPMRPAA